MRVVLGMGHHGIREGSFEVERAWEWGILDMSLMPPLMEVDMCVLLDLDGFGGGL